MSTTQGRGRIVMWLIVAAACVAWLSWVVSPEVEEPAAASEAEETPVAAPAPIAPVEPVAPVAKAAPEPTAAPSKEEPAQEPAEEAKPERIPTPHPMSLDQTKPPEQFGALAELKKQYDSESRGAASSETEARLRALIDVPNIPSELVQDIQCRRTVCKIETRWIPRRRIGFSVLVESFKNMYSQRVAVEPAAAEAADGTYPTTLFIRLK